MQQPLDSTIQRDALNPYPWYRLMRNTAPVHYNPERSCWDVFCYEDVLTVLNTPEIFSNSPGTAAVGTPLESSLGFADPPRHKRLRAITTKAFSPKQLALLEPRIAEIVNGVLDQVLDQGTMDVVTDFAYPIPLTTIAEMLGVPPEDQKDFKRWGDETVANVDVGLPTPPELDAYMLRVIAERKQHPKDDLISALVHTQVEGDHLTEKEVLGNCLLLLLAGYQTSGNLLINLFRIFDEAPETMQAVWADPQVIAAMIEETLRYRAPQQLMFRFAAQNVELQGQQILQGQVLMPMIGSANRDERQFVDPDRFDLHRNPNRHVAFGLGGIHFCLGAPLARMEARVALSLVRQRMTNIRCVPGHPLEAVAFTVDSVKHLPIVFDAR